MRLIDADELNKNAHICLTKDVAPTVEAVPMSIIKNIKAEIVKTVCEESNQCDGDSGDLKWCAGLGYSLKIIDKHIIGKAESEEGNESQMR